MTAVRRGVGPAPTVSTTCASRLPQQPGRDVERDGAAAAVRATRPRSGAWLVPDPVAHAGPTEIVHDSRRRTGVAVSASYPIAPAAAASRATSREWPIAYGSLMSARSANTARTSSRVPSPMVRGRGAPSNSAAHGGRRAAQERRDDRGIVGAAAAAGQHVSYPGRPIARIRAARSQHRGAETETTGQQLGSLAVHRDRSPWPAAPAAPRPRRARRSSRTDRPRRPARSRRRRRRPPRMRRLCSREAHQRDVERVGHLIEHRAVVVFGVG